MIAVGFEWILKGTPDPAGAVKRMGEVLMAKTNQFDADVLWPAPPMSKNALNLRKGESSFRVIPGKSPRGLRSARSYAGYQAAPDLLPRAGHFGQVAPSKST